MNNRKKILLLCMVWLIATAVHAVKAWPFPVEVRQADGTWLTIVQYGDEDFHYCMTTDSVLLVEKNGSWYVGKLDEYGDLVATSQLAHTADRRSAAERALVASQRVSEYVRTGLLEAERRKARREPIITSGSMFPHTGTPKAVVILAEFKDEKFSIDNPKRSFDEYFNLKTKLPNHGFGENANLTGVSQYFSDVSFQQFVPQFDVYGPVTLKDSLKVYGGTRSDGKDEQMDLLFQNACKMMDDSLDFSQYDANNDGKVDLVIIIYAGYSQSMSGNSAQCIWPKSGTTSGGKYDKKQVSRYAVSAELNGFPDCWGAPPYKRINGIGTLCHEFCHTMGLPDFYPTVPYVKGDNQAMEYWSLMDSGNYLINGYAPVALNAWEREALGWLNISSLTEDSELEIKPIDDGGMAYRIPNPKDGSGHEYYIIENIQNVGPNVYQKGHGLLVYHVDYDAALFSLSNNSVNNQKGHPRMTIVPADGMLFAQYNIGKTIDGKIITNSDFFNQLAGDPFPGTTGATAVNDTLGLTNFAAYVGSKSNIALEDIREEGGVVKLKYYTDFKMHHESRFKPGDVNHDGETDITDVLLVVDNVLKRENKRFCSYHADIIRDNNIDLSDALWIVDILLGRK